MAATPKTLDKPQTAVSLMPPADSVGYDAWFDEQVKIGLLEADDPKTVWVSNDEVFRQIDERLHALQERKAS